MRKELFARGFRFRLHVRDLPGSPDIVLPRWRAVVFVNGCFWHRHDCKRFSWPKKNSEFWQKKINGNVERDEKSIRSLLELGWRVAVVWQCEAQHLLKGGASRIVNQLDFWLRDSSQLNHDFFRGD